MPILVVLLLGLVEGLTEFIPVSSTGHLILAGALLGFRGDASATFDIVIQLGAILAVVVVYRRRFGDVLAGLARRDPSAVAFARNVALGVVPVLIVGALAYHQVKALLESPTVVAVALVAGGVAILAIERLALRPAIHSVETIGRRAALGIGVVQCLSMIPGVSRSGATIMGALGLGVDRRTAAEYSFFLAIPVMLAASAKELWEQRHALGDSQWSAIGLGFAASFIVALAVIRGFVALVSRHGFAPFAWYRIVVGSAALVWLAAR